MKKILSKWYWVIIGGFVLFAALIFIALGSNSVIAIHDNLDLFAPQYKMMKDTGTFFSHEAKVPFLANISRDYLPSEFNLCTTIYMMFPGYAAYIICYFLKIGIGIVGCILLAKDILKERFGEYESIVFLTAFAFAILNLFPNFGISFASIPVLVFILRRIVIKPHIGWYIALFCYPFISYFSYFGIFFIGYLIIYFVYKWIASKKFPFRVLIAIPVLSLGYMAFEYRLFSQMLFSDVTSIRATMVKASLELNQIPSMIWEGFAIGDMHTESMQLYLIMPICLIFFVLQNIGFCVKKTPGKMFKDYFNGVMLFILFNSVIYGLHYWEPFRILFETLLPPLKGFEFNRTQFTNPFLWYVAFFLVLKKVYDYLPKLKWLANILAIASIMIIVLSPTRFNDLYSTCRAQYSLLKNGAPNNELTYKEFFSEDLFAKAKKDIDYDGEWSVAYGFYPAVLEYNGIHTLDGYLGFYSQFYKEEFRKIIAPALERVPESKQYFDAWGARCSIYSGTYISNTNAYRNYEYTDENLYIDMDAFKDYLGRYIFSRVRINNADELGIKLVNTYTDVNSPYTLYLYQTISWYVDKEHSNIPYEQRDMSYNTRAMDAVMTQISEAVEEANGRAMELPEEEKASVLTDAELDKMECLHQELYSELQKLSTSHSIVNIEFYKDINDDRIGALKDEIYDKVLDYSDLYLQTLREIANSPYEEALTGILYQSYIDELKEYEDMTEEEKAREVKLEALQTEYEQLMNEDCYFDYKGQAWSLDTLEEQMIASSTLLENEDVLAIYKGIYDQKGLAVGEIYRQIVQLLNEEAIAEGYDNYAEYAYASIYPRDYTVEDVKKLCGRVRRFCGLFLAFGSDYVEQLDVYEPKTTKLNDTDTFEGMLPVLNEINPEFVEPMEHLLELRLYDMMDSPTKSARGFTMSLPSYGDAYIFDSPYGNSTDIFTYTHEYGHYLNDYYANENMMTSISNIDTAEIHSQGLEALFNSHYKEIYGEQTGDYLEANNIFNLMNAIYDSCMNSEFEIYVFEHPEATVEEIGIEYARISKKYGYDYGVPRGEPIFFWVDINHFFSQPCYYISYATSAFAALDIYVNAIDDEAAAVRKYTQISALSSEWLFRETLQYVGLPDVFESNAPYKIFKKAYKRLKGIAGKYE